MADLFDLSDSLEQLLIIAGLAVAGLTPLLDVGGAMVASGIGLMWSKGEIG
ncbi:hypothetical protein HY994_02195 [Candidatus Micrarchaeota archaeon]|nr:hypothetical protein [Candidatus Micrarchaeota archaeon]